VRGQLQFIGSDGPLDDDISDDAKQNAEEYIAKKFLTEQRRQQWGNLSDMAREQFYWENPGEPFVVTPSASTSSTIPTGGRDDDGKVLPPPDTFLLMLLYPTRVDYLRLSDNYHQVDDLERDDGMERSGRWIAKRVNP
jgi:pyridoxamine 5'-phosphate oxidase